ncbi:MAG: hypothetical protein ACR2L4_07450 [Actinomycetota bacterium]
MDRGGPGDLPRWLGWALAIPCGVTFVFRTFVIIVVVLASHTIESEVFVPLLTVDLLALLGLIAGIRILKAQHSG